MNEDERGITPANVTAMTVEPKDSGWLVTIEQGNGDVIKTVELTDMERVQLAVILSFGPGCPPGITHYEFVDFTRPVSAKPVCPKCGTSGCLEDKTPDW